MKTSAPLEVPVGTIFPLAAAMACFALGSTLHAAPVIHESGNYAAATELNGTAATGTGLTGNWINTAVGVTAEASSMSFGSLAQSNNEIRLSTAAQKAASVKIGTELAAAGLLGHGRTLWFSFLVNPATGSGTNDNLAFAFGTARLGTGNATPMDSSGKGVGAAYDRGTNLTAAYWSNGTRITESAGSGLTKGVANLVVAKIQWGATASDNETVTLYKPATSLAPPAPYSSFSTTLALDQSAFNTITFTHKNNLAGGFDIYDEIRFGASYADVVPISGDVTAPSLVSTSPTHLGTDQGVLLQATFDEGIAAGSGNIRIYDAAAPGSPYTTISATDFSQIATDVNVLKITPSLALVPGQTYYVEMDSGAVRDGSDNNHAGITGDGTWKFTVESTPPTLVSIVDNVNGQYPFLGYPVGGPIYAVATEVTYTVTFDEPMKASSVNAADFGNSGSPAPIINSVTPTANPAIFTVKASPGGAGTLQLQIKAGATIEDISGNALNTGVAIPDDTSITILAGGNPVIALDGFEGMNTSSISVAANAPLTNWEEVTSRYYPTYFPGGAVAQTSNVLTDQAGTDGSGGTTPKGVRVRSSTGSMALKAPMPLVALGAETVTIAFDLKQTTLDYRCRLAYSASGTFGLGGGPNDTVVIANFEGLVGDLGVWMPQSFTLTDGEGGIVFTDTAQFRIGKPASNGSGANSTFHIFDNIKVSWAGATGDTTPPVWAATWPQVDTVTSTSLTARAKTDEDGTAYYVVLAGGAPAPSSAQVKAGNDSSNSPALKSSSLALTANVENTAAVTDLTAGTAYDVWFAAEDGVPNLQASPSKVSVTTLTPYDTWAGGHGLAGASALSTTDVEPDGLVNLLEFGFGTNPNGSDNGPLVADGSVNGTPISVFTGSGGGITFDLLYVRRDDHGTSGSASYTVQFSGDLVTFHDSTATPTFVADSTDDPAYEVVKVPYPVLLPDGKKARFARVKVELLP